MRRLVCICIVGIIMATTPGSASAQDPSNPEELNRKYQEAVAQLKAAQDRKNELATENEKLTAEITQLRKQLADAKSEVVSVSDRTFQMRLEYYAFQEFLKRRGLLREWKIFMDRAPLVFQLAVPEEIDTTSPLLPK
jgi:septal ring factor EnvC (AmiA/AmiB activator)